MVGVREARGKIYRGREKKKGKLWRFQLIREKGKKKGTVQGGLYLINLPCTHMFPVTILFPFHCLIS